MCTIEYCKICGISTLFSCNKSDCKEEKEIEIYCGCDTRRSSI